MRMMRMTLSAPVRQSGFGLAEIMVALVIGLITTLVIMQVMTNFEGQKLTTSGNADAQTNGSIALYMMQRQIQIAGYGLPVFSHQNQPLHCDPSPTIDHDGNAATAEIGIAPIAIVDGGNGPGASDRIVIHSGNSSTGGIPITISNVIGNNLNMTNNLGCEVNDIAIITNGTSCAMTKVTAITGTTQISLLNAAGAVAGATLGCMSGWNEVQYQVNNNNLTENGSPAVSGIVNIQAQYGISAAPDKNQVTTWVDASGATWGAPTITNRNRIKAIRLAVVARNGLLEKENVTAPCSSLTSNNPTGLCAWAGTADNPAPAIDLSRNADGSDNPNWRRYRYRVFETIIPLRSMIWSSDTL